MGRCVADMANHENLEHSQPAKVRGWIEVIPADPADPLAAQVQIDWVAFLNVRTPDGQEFRLPVVPDEFNPRPNKIVRPEDKPHVFLLMREAEEAANKELPGLIKYVEDKI